MLAISRLAFPERSLEDTGTIALANAGFAIGLLVILLITAYGLGHWIVRALRLQFPLSLDRIVFSTAIGLGVVAYGVLFLGLIGLLRPLFIVLWLLVCAGLAAGEWGIRKLDIGSALTRLRTRERVALLAALLVLLLSGIQALAPVWDYDGLMYHLQAPRLFLEAGRIELRPDLWQANLPLAPEMLYIIGVALESDAFVKLMHLSFAALLVMATYAVAREYLGPLGGWLAAGVLLGIPIFPIWGSLAYSDMAWSLYEFLAVAALLRWRVSQHRGWLIAGGIMMGLALGSKLVALGLLPLLAFWILWSERKNNSPAALKAFLLFAAPAFALAAPWYIKNLLLAGNPFYPFLFGGPEWPADRLKMLTAYLQGFGSGDTLADLVALPWNLYANRIAFGTYMTSIDIPSLLFPLALAFPFVGTSDRLRETGWIVLMRFLIWAAATQQTRFLLPVYPLLSVWTAGTLVALLERFRSRTLNTALAGIVGGLVASTLVYQTIYMQTTQPVDVVLGIESKDSFLRRMVDDYPATRFIAENLEEGDRVYFMWDGQGYYCERGCLPDAEQSQWAQLVTSEPDASVIAAHLRDQGVTHLLLDLEGLNFMLQHDPTGRHGQAAAFTFDHFIPMCLEETAAFPKAQLYELHCDL